MKIYHLTFGKNEELKKTSRLKIFIYNQLTTKKSENIHHLKPKIRESISLNIVEKMMN